MKNRFEHPPYTDDTKRSVYHIRELDAFKLKQLSNKIDIGLSHDWPRNVHKFGDFNQLMEIRPNMREDIENNCLGSPPTQMLVRRLKPTYWFSAHMHVFFNADIRYKDSSSSTKFMAVSECSSENTGENKFIEIIDIATDHKHQELKLAYDVEWLTILKNTENMQKTDIDFESNYTPNKNSTELVLERFNHDLNIPLNFCRTSDVYDPLIKEGDYHPQHLQRNPQTTRFCDTLGIVDPGLKFYK